jgi:hypothetical protein
MIANRFLDERSSPLQDECAIFHCRAETPTLDARDREEARISRRARDAVA